MSGTAQSTYIGCPLGVDLSFWETVADTSRNIRRSTLSWLLIFQSQLRVANTSWPSSFALLFYQSLLVFHTSVSYLSPSCVASTWGESHVFNPSAWWLLILVSTHTGRKSFTSGANYTYILTVETTALHCPLFTWETVNTFQHPLVEGFTATSVSTYSAIYIYCRCMPLHSIAVRHEYDGCNTT